MREKTISNSNDAADDEDDDRRQKFLLMDNTNVQWLVLVMDTVAENMYCIHNEDRDDSVGQDEDDGDEDACLLS